MAKKTVSPTVVVTRGDLPFWTTQTTARGRWIGSSCFDPPAEMLASGTAGEQIALALVRRVLEAKHRRGLQLRDTMIDAGKAAREGGGELRLAALGFLNVMTDIALGGIRHTNAEEFAVCRLAEMERQQAFLREYYERRRVEFVERMKAGRAAKRQRAQAAGVSVGQ